MDEKFILKPNLDHDMVEYAYHGGTKKDIFLILDAMKITFPAEVVKELKKQLTTTAFDFVGVDNKIERDKQNG